MLKKTLHILSLLATTLCVALMWHSCADESIDGQHSSHLQKDGNGNVIIQFSTQVPGMVLGSRAAGEVDKQIGTLYLYLFDKNGFTGITTATELKHSDGQYVNGEYTSQLGTYYSATVPETTQIVHFVADLTLTAEEIEAAKEQYEDEFFPTFITEQRTYWGRHTIQELEAKTTVVLYRNYAKVKVRTVADGLNIEGWTLYYEPTQGTVAPFNRENGNRFDYELGTSGVTLPQEKNCSYKPNTTDNQTTAKSNIENSTDETVYTLFEHSDKGYSERVCAIFQIKTTEDNTTRYYKIELLEDTQWSDEGNVIRRTPYDIKRNHEYIIKFNGISTELGYENLADAIANGAANNSEVEVEKKIPEIISLKHTLRVEQDATGSSTVRYYKNTGSSTTYTINDILIYYDGDNCTENKSAQGVESLKAVWEESLTGASDSITIEKTDTDHTYRLSFTTTGFTEGENGINHYKTGLIRIREQHEHVLSRYVRVYIGPAITFRPLLYSSDIPNLTDERLSILFTIPDRTYLPEDLYPIEILFGSDRVDIEQNQNTDAMKVDFGGDAAKDYTHVLRWQGTEGSEDWSWKAAESNTVTNTWGYKYVYTINSPEEAGEKRITLRTVQKSDSDFKVMMEGRSTVTGTNIFNTRELDFMMQNDGEATFSEGEWTTKTTGTTDQYQRIMLNGGLPETRMVTRYVNLVGAEVGDTLTIPYTLGTWDEDSLKMDTIAPATSDGNVNIQVFHDTEKLKYEKHSLTDANNWGNIKTDADGNQFVSIRVVPKNSDGTGWIKFTLLDKDIKNSVVFLSARNQNKYGTETWNDAGNTIDYIYTGHNTLAHTYRSASAIINIMDTWKFNPAPSLTASGYKYATSAAVPLGKDEKLYVRIDRPSGEANVQLTFDTQSKFTLVNNTSEFSNYTVNNDGTYTVTLASSTSEYCYLEFTSTAFSSACTIKMSSTSDSSITYESAELTVTNSAVTFQKFEFANEATLSGSTPFTYATNQDTVPSIKGALEAVRVYLPTSLKDQGEFSFNMTSSAFCPVNKENVLTTVIPETNQTSFDDYTVTPSQRIANSYVIKTSGSNLVSSGDTLCYIDLLVKTTKIPTKNDETVKFQGTNESSDDISFHPYATSIRVKNVSYTATVKQSQSADDSGSTNALFTAEPEAGTNVYYKIAIPNMGLPRLFEITLYTNGVLSSQDTASDNIKEIRTDDTNNTITYVVQSAENATSEVTLHLQTTSTSISNNKTIRIDMGGDPYADDDITDLGDVNMLLLNEKVYFWDGTTNLYWLSYYDYNNEVAKAPSSYTRSYNDGTSGDIFMVSEDTDSIQLKLKATRNANGNYEPTTLTIRGWGAFGFKGSSKYKATGEEDKDEWACYDTIQVTPTDSILYATIIPKNKWTNHNGISGTVTNEAGEELNYLGGGFNLEGYSENLAYNKLWVDVNVKPRLLVSLCGPNKQALPDSLKKGDSLYLKVTVPARYTERESISFSISNGNSKADANTYLTNGTPGKNMTFVARTDDNFGGTVTINLPDTTNTPQDFYYSWIASKGTGSNTPKIKVGVLNQDNLYDTAEINSANNSSQGFDFAITPDYTVTYYKEGFTTSSATYNTFRTDGYDNGDKITLPNSYPTSGEVTATQWVTVTTDDAGKATRTPVTSETTVTSSMSVYPVYPVQIGSTEATINPVNVFETNGNIYTKNENQLIDSSYDGSYILFQVTPTESGWYSFTSNISAASGDNPKVTLGYVDANGTYTQSEQLNIEKNNRWKSDDNFKYTWNFELTAGTTYTFKMLCNVSSSYCVNVYEMTVARKIVSSTRVVLSAETANSSASDTVKWVFNNSDVTITNSEGKGCNADNTKYIKMSRNVEFTINADSDSTIVRVEFWAYATGENWSYLHKFDSWEQQKNHYSPNVTDSTKEEINETIQGFTYPCAPGSYSEKVPFVFYKEKGEGWTQAAYKFCGTGQVSCIIVIYTVPTSDLPYYNASYDSTTKDGTPTISK